MLDRLTALTRRLARHLFDSFSGEMRQGWRFRAASWCWRQARYCFHRLCRRQPPFLIVLDGPAVLSGFASLSGWSISRGARVLRVRLFINGQCLAETIPNAERPDVQNRFSHYRWVGPCGFRLAPEPGTLGDGHYSALLVVEDEHGRVYEKRTPLLVRDYRHADTSALPAHLQGSDREYQVWIEHQPQISGKCTSGPFISVVMPIYRPRLDQLLEAVTSVRQQTYRNWELCLCDDGSGQDLLTQALAKLACEENRIRVFSLPQNQGISKATNTAIGHSRGEFVAFMDQDDRLAPTALEEVAQAAQRSPFDLLYTDEDRLDHLGCRMEPFFKPDWSPELLWGMMYLAHLCVYRRSFLDRIGWCNSAFDGAQDWELALRATSQTCRIVHLPRILYHWRLGGNSAGSAFNRLCHERGRRAIAESLQRLGHDATVTDGPSPCTFHVRHSLEKPPLVSILIPTRDNPRQLRNCIRSIRKWTAYPRYEILVIDNGSRRTETLRYLQRCGAERVLRYDVPFNHSLLNNLAAREARGELLLLLNDDTLVRNAEWLHALAEQATRPEVGAAGAWLFFPDGRTQHNGIVLGVGPVASPLHSGLTRDGLDRGTCRLIRDVSAVTGACLMIRKQLYQEIGGLDAEYLPTSFNDVDLCMRLRRAGYRIVQTPLAQLVHYESMTRRMGAEEAGYIQRMWERWGAELSSDPYWNPNLSQGVAPPPGLSFAWPPALTQVRSRAA